MSGWIAGAAIVSAGIGYAGASKAAKATDKASERASQRLDDNFEATAARLDPYSANVGDAMKTQRIIAGLEGTAAQQKFYEDFQLSPYSEFQRREGLKVIDQQTGGRMSGTRYKFIEEFINGLNSAEINNRFNQAGAIIGTGLAADSAIAGVGGNTAAGQAQIIQNQGIEAANARLGQTAALQSGISDLAALFANRNTATPTAVDNPNASWSNYKIGGL